MSYYLNNLPRSDSLSRLEGHYLSLTPCLAAGDDIVLPSSATSGRTLNYDGAGARSRCPSGGRTRGHDHHPALSELTRAGHHQGPGHALGDDPHDQAVCAPDGL